MGIFVIGRRNAAARLGICMTIEGSHLNPGYCSAVRDKIRAKGIEKSSGIWYHNTTINRNLRGAMKTLYFIGGTMGVGKTTVSQQLKKSLNNSVFLDGDWCWDADPFQVTEETKAMVVRNICYLLNSFLHCSAYENVIFCWVMHEQSIIDSIMQELDTENCEVKIISLTVDEVDLRNRLMADVASGLRTADVIERSVARIPLYRELDTIKIDTSHKTVREIVDEILRL